MRAEPFEVAVPDAELEDFHTRLQRTRWADDLGNADWRYGVERGWLEDMVRYWRKDYDWRKAEQKINQLANFKVTIDGVPLHFVHMRGRGPDSIPLLLLHGWPWTFMDFHALIGPLLNPAAHGADAADSFDIIIPSLPGFAYSMPLTRTGLDVPRSAELFATLLTDVLGYERFGVAGGDWGAVLCGQIAHAHPERVIGLLTSIPLFPGLDLAKITPQDHDAADAWMIERRAASAASCVSHVAVQANDPQTLAYALVDSPVGTAAWLWERRRAWSDCGGELLAAHDRDFLCTLASIYYLTRSIGTSMRSYWEHFHSGMPIVPAHNRMPVIEVPCAFAVYPKEVVLVPRSVVAKMTNLKRWTYMPRGGHFGISEQPAAFVNELRTFFRTLRNVRAAR
jgi:pimeloyl-ACP methyl ester carboxylesterase